MNAAHEPMTTTAPAAESDGPRYKGDNWRTAAALLAATAALFVLIMPVVLIFVTAFKPDAEIVRFEGLFPREWTFANFREVFANAEEIPIGRWLVNSIYIAASVTALVLLVCSLAAYGLARLRLPGAGFILALIVATLMIPGQMQLVPVYMLLNWLGWIDTPLSLIIPAGSGAFGVFLLHQFFLGLPRDLEEAAHIDGCSRLRIWWTVILPLSKPALSTLGIFTFIGSWNDFVGPLVFIDSLERYTLPVGVALFQSSYKSEYGLTLAASVLCTLPVIIIFALLQKHIIRGIALTGLKE